MGPGTYDSPGVWKERGVDLTYEEKEFLRSVDSQGITIDELIALVEKSSFEKKDTLVQKLKKASEKMKR